MTRVAIIGIGSTNYRSSTPELSYREMIFEAATKAYADAGIAHTEIGSFVTCAEDFHEGYSIADEYTPDQLGAVLKPMQTVPGDFLHGLATAYMMIAAGLFRIVAVEAHSKASNILTPGEVAAFALDPVLNRPLGLSAHFVAGLEMNRYLHETGTTLKQCAAAVVQNRSNALKNPLAAYGAKLSVADVEGSEEISSPLRREDVSQRADGAIVMLLASEDAARSLSKRPVWIAGIGWCSDSAALEGREWGRSISTELAAKKAYAMAGVNSPAGAFDLVEVEDEYSYKMLQHLEELGFCERGEAGRLLEEGKFAAGGTLPVNVSGGSLGLGHLLDASGAARSYEAVLQLRGGAGARQLSRASRAIVQSWRGVPTTSSAVMVLTRK